ncbi:MAG: ATP-binding cassette domain-containing protein, partial [Longicatena sp.]
MELKVQNLKKSFENNEVLHGVSFSITSGKALGLLGRNGAGKTTTIRILMDVFKANSGTITIDGKPFIPSDYRIGYLPEERGLYPKKRVDEQLIYLAILRGSSKTEAKASVKKWLTRLGISEYEKRKLETLSKGNQQKVQLAQTILGNPDIIILDEPFSGLDPVNSQVLQEVVMELIKEGKLVIFSSHQMNYVEEFCEDIIILHHGDVVLSGDLKTI